jgi:hypothetical protein
MYASRIALINAEIEHWQLNGGARRSGAAWALSRAAAARGNGRRNRGRPAGLGAAHVAVPWVTPLPPAHVVGPLTSRASLAAVVRRLENGERLPVYNRMMPPPPSPVGSASSRSTGGIEKGSLEVNRVAAHFMTVR